MDEHEFIAERSGANLTHLRTMAHWVLGSQSEADDALDEACTRLSRYPRGIDNLGERLTTVLAQICLDRLRARAAQSAGLSADASVANVSM
jgi:DNA-directed RNA polymerase specialized sigma24 family protein